MAFFKKLKQQSAVNRLLEQQLYNKVSIELQSGIRKEGIWAMALAQSSGNIEKAKARYLKLRVQSLLDEELIVDQIANDFQSENREGRFSSLTESNFTWAIRFGSNLGFNMDEFRVLLEEAKEKGDLDLPPNNLKREVCKIIEQKCDEYISCVNAANSAGLTLRLDMDRKGIAVFKASKQVRYCFSLGKLRQLLSESNNSN